MKTPSRLVCVLLAAGVVGSAQPKVNAQSLVLADFDKRLKAYTALRQTLDREQAPLKPTNALDNIRDHRVALAEAIVAARKTAVAGDLFTPEVAVEIRRLIAIAMTGPGAKRIRKSLASAEPRDFKLEIHRPFPPGMPLQTMPATILANLPTLPPELDYRVVGRNLVLRDSKANLMIDFMTEALP